jgi:hypothetical protein
MPSRNPFILAVFLACLFQLSSRALAADAITVTVQPAVVETKTFDPADPPQDMPALSQQEAAVAHSAFGVQSSLEAVVTGERSQNGQTTSALRVDAVQMELSLAVTLWLPHNAPRELVAHEQGHRRISEMFYKDAERIARAVAENYIGRTITGQGANPKAAREAALNKAINDLNMAYMSSTQVPSVRTNTLFDDITQHGRNTKITVDQAIRQAMQRYADEQKKKPSTTSQRVR